MNYDFNGKKHQFVYGSNVEDSALTNKVTFPFLLDLFGYCGTEPRGTSVFAISFNLLSVIFQKRTETCRLLKNRL